MFSFQQKLLYRKRKKKVWPITCKKSLNKNGGPTLELLDE